MCNVSRYNACDWDYPSTCRSDTPNFEHIHLGHSSCIIGATALLAAVDTDIRDIGWYYLPVVLLSSTLALVVALITNNVQRRYPVFWFYPSTAPTIKMSPETPQSDKTLTSQEGTPKEKKNVLGDCAA